jgi:hypothetical protein
MSGDSVLRSPSATATPATIRTTPRSSLVLAALLVAGHPLGERE